jgi:GNAT superfamily N-acetyltransferase
VFEHVTTYSARGNASKPSSNELTSIILETPKQCVLNAQMTQELLIRTVNDHDLPQLIGLYQHLIPNEAPISLEMAEGILDDFLKSSGNAIFAGFLGDTMVSSCTLIVVPNLTRGGRPYCFIENVVTHAAHRKKGYGSAVMQAAIASAWQQNCYKIMLLTGSKDPATLNFYSSAGFEQSKTGFQMRRIPPKDS